MRKIQVKSYTPVGWRGESYRHYLASKGMNSSYQKINGRRRYFANWRNELDYVRAGIKPVASVSIRKDQVLEFNQELNSNRLNAIQDKLYLGEGVLSFAVSKPENVGIAKEFVEHSEGLWKGKIGWTPEEGEKTGEQLGYPPKAVAEWSLRSQIVRGFPRWNVDGHTAATDPEIGEEIGEYMGVGRPKEDLDYLEFLPGSDVEETKRAITIRKAATREANR